MPRMEKGKEVRFEPHDSNWAPDSLTDSQGSEHSAWMGSVAVEQSFNVGVFRLLAVDRPTPRMCLIFRSILKPRVCSQGQQGWCLEPSWPGLSSHKSTLQGPRGFRDCWGGAVGFGEWRNNCLGKQFHPWKALQYQIAPKEPPLTAKGAQVMNTSQGKRPSDFNSQLEISFCQQAPTSASLSSHPAVKLCYAHTIFDLFNVPESLLDNEVVSPFQQGKSSMGPNP